MAFPTDIPPSTVPTYFVYRDGDPSDTTAPPVFFPPKDSDELFDALRAKYPHVRSHSDRMRDAIIEFLIEERDAENFNDTSPAVPSLGGSSMTASPWQHSWPSMSSTCQNSPETVNLMTPTFGDSPYPQPQMARQASTAGASSTSSPPAIDQMTSVFSLSTSEQPKQRVRRKMTEAEKVEYRKRRIVKACEKCSKRKRKCNHNTPDVDVSNTTTTTKTKASQKVKKPRYNKKAVDRAWPLMPFAEIEPGEDFEAMKHHLPASYAPTEDFEAVSTLLDQPIPDINFDEFTDFSQQHCVMPIDQYGDRQLAVDPSLSQWSWSDHQDWTLMDPVSGDAFTPQFADGNMLDDMAGLLYPYNLAPLSSRQTNIDEPAMHDYQQWHTDQLVAVNANATNCHGSQGGHGLSYASGPRSSTAELKVPTPSPRAASGKTMLWEHLRTGQQGSGGSAFLIGDGDPGATSDMDVGTPGADDRSLARIVLRLVGTARAARAFASLLPSGSSPLPRSQLHSRGSSGLAGVEESVARTRLHNGGRMATIAPNADAESRHSGVFANAHANEAANANAFAPVLKDAVLAKQADLPGRSSMPLGTPGEGLLTMQPRGPRPLHASSPAGHLSLTSALSTNRSPFDEEGEEALRHRGHIRCAPYHDNPPPSGPATEFVRFKRRIMETLDSVLDRNNETLTPPNHDMSTRAYLPTRAIGGASPVEPCATLLSNARISTNAFASFAPTHTTTSFGTTAIAVPPVQQALRPVQPPTTPHEAEPVPESAYKPTWTETNRERDHHGRTDFFAYSSLVWIAPAAAVAVVWALAAWEAFVGRGGGFALSLLVGLLFAVCGGGDVVAGRDVWRCKGRVESAVRCSLRNSSWLARLLGSQVGRRRKDVVAAKHRGGKGMWAMGARRMALV